MIDDKDFYNIIRMLFGFGDYREMYSEINKDTGLRESGITIVNLTKKKQETDRYEVSINWELLKKLTGGEE